jgi:CRISPR-associated protein Csx3
MTRIRFDVKEEERWSILTFELDDSLTPSDLKTIDPPKVKGTKGVILSGRGPIWLYGFLIHYYHPTKFIATYDPREGAVIVESHTHRYRVGDVIKVEV